jgi:hypothetical protein
MNLPKRRIVLIAVAGLVCLGLVALVWSLGGRARASLRLTFLYATNAPGPVVPNGTMGVFRVENDSQEVLQSGGGFFQVKGHRGFEGQEGEYGASILLSYFPPGTTNIMMWVPTNGGPWRLVMYFRLDLRRASPLRLKAAEVAQRASFRLPFLVDLGRLGVGGRYATTEFFQARPSDIKVERLD